MFLCAYVINGSSVNELNNWETYQLNGNQAYIFSETVPAGYQDITSISNLDGYGMGAGKDYKFVRVLIYIQMMTIGWENLSIAEKTICSRWFVVLGDKRIEVHTVEEQIENGKSHHEKSRQNRFDRHTACLMEVFNRLDKLSAQTVLMSLETNGLLRLYIEYGIEGTLQGDITGIVDYINSVVGTPYENNGLMEESETPDDPILLDLKNRLIDIIVNGNY